MSDKKPLTRPEALLYLSKILPVWPEDYETVEALHLKDTGWVFGKCDSDTVYADRSLADTPIYKVHWREAIAQRYGINNDREDVMDDEEFLQANAAALAEKGDGYAAVGSDPIDQPAIQQMIEDATCVTCIEGHVYIAMTDHPLDGNELPHCPHCMAEALSYISGFRVKG